MSIEIYISRDSHGRAWPPDTNHEMLAVIDIVRQLQNSFHHQPEHYAIVANLHHKGASADLVFISELVLGIVELKHYFGSVHERGKEWFAGAKRISAGAANNGCTNPHQQVQKYAEIIRNDLIKPLKKVWLPGESADWKDLKFNTAVCFTNRWALVEDFKKIYLPNSEPWERFHILQLAAVPEWVAAMRFEANLGYAHKFEPYRLTSTQITRIAKELLKATKWTEVADLMKKSYAYLTLMENNQPKVVFGLDGVELFVGRDPENCKVKIPLSFSQVGRIHACIAHSFEGIFIEDLGSQNGVYINGQPIHGRQRLTNKQQITLGGSMADDKVCLLEFSFEAPKVVPTEITQR